MYGLIAPPSTLFASPYTASKHGVVGLTKSDANNYAPQGIRINALCPGYVKTPLLMESERLGYMKEAIRWTPMGRMAETEEIGDVVVFLAGEMSSFMSGACLVVDGGYTVS
jgi:NAD(P)-dependent dehydrogenase (short-subunit alcohol dehydrogenase family)